MRKLVHPRCSFYVSLYARFLPSDQSLHCNGTHLARYVWLSALLLFVVCAASHRDVMCKKTEEKS